ncbi:MAG: hypothetical protein IRY98_06370, partial [Alicyclobacillaceae bacterium]|nr:hypothetical protein [Alicyclobacillaceae bacterium]
MMGRKVYITSDMSIDDRLIEVAEEDEMAAAMWPWFLTALDDWGRCLANPKSLKNKVFQLFPSMDAEAIERALQLYANAGLIRLYEVDGRRYAAVPAAKWWKYQTHIRKDKRQKDDSRYPAPPSDVDAQEQDGAETDAESDAQLRADAREDAESRANARTSPPSPTPTTLPPYYTSLTDSSGSGGSNA